MKKTFEFYCAEPLLSFINQYRDRIIGQHIRRFYSWNKVGTNINLNVALKAKTVERSSTDIILIPKVTSPTIGF